MEKPKNIELPAAWTELNLGLNRGELENILQFPRVTIYLDAKPVAVLVSVEEYQKFEADLARLRAVGLLRD